MKNKLLKWYDSAGLVNESNREIIELGIDKAFSTMAMWVFTIACAGLMGDFLVGILFETGYIPFRRYAGGYHAKTRKRCSWLTYSSTFIFLLLVFVIPMNRIIFSFVVLLFLGIIYKRVPLQSKNKPLNSVEKKVYRRKALIIAVFDTMAFFVFLYLGIDIYAKTIFFAMMLVVFGLVCVNDNKFKY
jgi:accessory gene regulator B